MCQRWLTRTHSQLRELSHSCRALPSPMREMLPRNVHSGSAVLSLPAVSLKAVYWFLLPFTVSTYILICKKKTNKLVLCLKSHTSMLKLSEYTSAFTQKGYALNSRTPTAKKSSVNRHFPPSTAIGHSCCCRTQHETTHNSGAQCSVLMRLDRKEDLDLDCLMSLKKTTFASLLHQS